MYFIYICCRSEQKPNAQLHIIVKFHCRPPLPTHVTQIFLNALENDFHIHIVPSKER